MKKMNGRKKIAACKKSETNVYKQIMFIINVVWPYLGVCVCRVILGKMPYKKDIVDKCLCFSYFCSWLMEQQIL